MNLAKLKNYAPQARREFIQAMTDRAAFYGLTATTTEPIVENGDVAVIGGRSYPIAIARKRKELEVRIKRHGFAQTMEAIAYTWFNRLVAIRFMELHGYLDHGYRVLSHPDGKPTPEILQYAEYVDLPTLKRESVIDLKLDGNKEAELYRLLLTAQCNALNWAMPFLFERIDDETELLLPDNLLHSDSLIRKLVSNLDAEDCETVEVLGWLYQFYIAEKKDMVMARKSAVPTDDIPAVTQLFTPHWIVRYLVENSLGRLWMQNRPQSKLRDHMPYYIEEESGAGILPASPQSKSGETVASLTAKSGETPVPHFFQPFNPLEETETSRRCLPHWQQEGTTYFITFRLGDSIPQEKLAQWDAERKDWHLTHPEPWDDETTDKYNTLFSERRQQWLDNGYGRCLLALPEIAEIVRSALLHFDGQRYLLDEFVLMPNHVHILVKPLPGHDLPSLLHTWKSFTAKAINKAIGATGTVWQDESYDHIVRSSSQLDFYRNYIRKNPVKAGLKNINSQCGTGVTPAISAIPLEETNKIKTPLSQNESGAGVSPAILKEETGKTPALLFQNESGVGVSPAIPSEETGKMPAPLFLKITKPEEIRLCDPAVGSGHMLTYAFDLLTLIYEEEGYAPTEIPALILRHNLYGLEICPRAAQLAELALVFKAREKSRRFFQPEHLVRPHIIELRDVRFAEDELSDYIHALGLGDLFNQPILRLLHQFEEAKNFGSLIQPCLDEQGIRFIRDAIEAKDLGGQLFLRETHLKVLRVLEQAEALTQRYHVVVANPPYMGGGQMNPVLKRFVGELYPKAAGDCAACFALRNIELALSGGRIGMITFQTWMFVSSFSEFREHLLSVGTVSSFVHNGRGVWGPDFGSCAFCFIARPAADTPGVFVRLFEKNSMVQSNEQLVAKFLNRDASRTFVRNSSSFRRVPGVPMAYWISDALADTFAKNPAISSFGVAKTGLSSGDKAVFCREWSEVSHCRIKFDARDHRDFTDESENPGTWAPLVTGGPFRKWYGNLEEVILWSDAGKKVREFEGSTIRNPSYYFKSGITWSDVTISTISFRFVPDGLIICDVGPMAFFDDEALVFKALAWGNTLYTERISKALNPTVHFKTGDFHRIPAKFPDGLDRALPEECVKIARADWDNFETSWDFRDQPLLRPGLKGQALEASWRNWEAQSTAAIRRMQELETENNRLFIAAYGLDGELQPEVPEAQITLARAEARRDMAAFLSYAVGCMMGRYSPDHPGLILANAGDSAADFRLKLTAAGLRMNELTFLPDEDGILPVLDGEWFEDDIVLRIREFLRATFGAASVDESVRFIEAALGRDLRDYFLSDFYRDHLQTYKNRPIYWLFSSGKQKAFQCLVYLHRYTPGTLARMRTEYVIPLQGKLAGRIPRLEEEIGKATTSTSRKKLQTDLDKTKKQIVELVAYDEQLRSYSDQTIALDLDDGVKVNYAKFGPLLAESKKVCGKDD